MAGARRPYRVERAGCREGGRKVGTGPGTGFETKQDRAARLKGWDVKDGTDLKATARLAPRGDGSQRVVEYGVRRCNEEAEPSKRALDRPCAHMAMLEVVVVSGSGGGGTGGTAAGSRFDDSVTLLAGKGVSAPS